MKANWGPSRTVLQGVLRTEFRYGPPNYGQSPWEDSVETPIILTLIEPLDVLPDARNSAEGDFQTQGFKRVTEVQVAVSADKGGPLDLGPLAGAMVEVSGELFPQHTGHHHRKVLIACDSGNIRLIAPFSYSTIQDARVLRTGSGILLNKDGYILTARHVAAGEALSVRRRLDRREATLVGIHRVLDIALLKSDLKATRDVALRITEPPMLGERIYACGFPLRSYLGHGVSFTEGVVSNDRPTRDGYFHFSAPIQPGNSGGPLLDGHGNLLAIIVAQAFPEGRQSNPSDIRQIQLLNEAAPVAALMKFLDDHGVETDLSPIIHSVPPPSVPATEAARLAEQVCIEVESWTTLPASPPEKLLTQEDLLTW